MKKVRINKMYGEWYYTKELDDWGSDEYVYHLWGTDKNGKEWSYTAIPYYNMLLEFIKADDETKGRLINY